MLRCAVITNFGSAMARVTGMAPRSGSPARSRWEGASDRLFSWLRYIVSSLWRTISHEMPTAIMAGVRMDRLPVISATISMTANGAREMPPKQHIMPTMT